jgi:tetratricopeptide (TPR) repeat protein
MQRPPEQALPSLLRPWQRRLLTAGLVVAGFVLANTLYLLVIRLTEAVRGGEEAAVYASLSLLLQTMVLGHTAAGSLLVLILLPFVIAHLPVVWARRHRESVISGMMALAAGVLLVVTGLFILTAAASEANRWAWWLHVVSAGVLPAGYVIHRVVGYTRPPPARFGRFAGAVSVLALALLMAHGLEAGYGSRPDPSDPPGGVPDQARGLAGGEAPSGGFTPAGFVPPSSRFFPSAASTASGGPMPARILVPEGVERLAARIRAEVQETGFAAETAIGAERCTRCHADIVAQWRASAHRFASFNNPFYEATVTDLRRSDAAANPSIEEHLRQVGGGPLGGGVVKSRWCAGCHDPALMLTGLMDGEVDRATPEAQAGLTCMACHAIEKIHGVTGNGNYVLADGAGDPYLFGGAEPGSLAEFLHDAALRARPAAHKASLLKPFFETGEYCATCHKVALDRPVNDYRWLRGQDEYDSWHDSGISRNAARTFYLPDEARVCQDCHMPPEPAPLGDMAARNGTVRSHRFLAANTALPFLRGDSATLRRTETFLRDGRLRVDLFALRRGASEWEGAAASEAERAGADGVPEMGLDWEKVTLRPGERVGFDVVVRNLGVGHAFPGGTNDSNQGWLEFSVMDEEGRVLGRSGHMGDDGHLDPMAHAYGAVLLDARGQRIDRRNGQDIRVAAATNVIGPGTADVARFELLVPEAAREGVLSVRVRLLWRKFNRPYTEFAYAMNPEGFKGFEAVPDLPVTEIARDEVRLAVAGGSGPSAPGGEGDGLDDSGFPTWMRFNDYGIAHLLQGNTRLAGAAFSRVAQLAPDLPDGHLNLARTALAAGNLGDAYDHLEAVEALNAGDPRAAWVWGVVLQEDGRYEQAAQAFRRVLEAFPADRTAWRNLGRTLYLDRRPEEAIQAFDRVLEIDPEDRIAHYFRMLALRVAGRPEEAALAEAAFGHYQIDESAQALSRAFRDANPGVNLMAQPLHSHAVTAVGGDPEDGRPE